MKKETIKKFKIMELILIVISFACFIGFTDYDYNLLAPHLTGMIGTYFVLVLAEPISDFLFKK